MQNEPSTPIADYTLTPVVATTIKISVMELILHSSVTIIVSFFAANGSQVKNEIVKVEGAEYTAWGLNDTYLTDLVFQKLGLSAPA